MPSIVICGAGDLGGAIAWRLSAFDVARRIVLVDEAEALAAGKALDIRQAAPVERWSTIVTGTSDLSAVIGASAIVVADRFGAGGEWRDEAGLALLRRLVGLNDRAPIVCAGTAQAALVERGVGELGIAPSRLLGSAAEALRAALVGLTALDAGCSPVDIALGVLGRPPRRVVVPWDAASIAGRAAVEVLEPHVIAALDATIPHLWPIGPFALASAAARMLRAALTRSPQTIYAQFVRDEPGIDRRAAIWPVKMGTPGIARVETPTLTTRDRVRVDAALAAPAEV